ncbi:collagenase 3-like [Polypterus senegalus]|uniref:collagenase 3-like n=1 Tax=Polypterus senegalus TaxID=55291 RepID=UPI0019649E49|nr:collagenase 3-like [Polypterus senegalus]
MLSFELLVFALFVAGGYAIPVLPDTSKQNDGQLAQDYLRRFYNLSSAPGDHLKRSSGQFAKKLKEMQEFFGLKVTGKLDTETIQKMKTPRCGVPEVASYSTFPTQLKWPTNYLTYRIENYTPDISKADVDKAISHAFEVWTEVTPLKITRIYSGTADIVISFVYGDHGDNSPFDGHEGILAHAFAPSPGIGGDTHFDEAESFSTGTSGYCLFLVAAHEFGHALGLSHSKDPGALMYPTYSYVNLETFTLSSDDIEGIQVLYGPNPDKHPQQPAPPKTPSACDTSLVLDAATTFRGETMFFKDRFLWRKSPGSVEVEQTTIKTFWPELPDKVDAVYESFVWDTIFVFKGKRVWGLQGYDILQGYPRSIQKFGFPPKVKKVDAALYIEQTRKTLFFVGTHYYSYDETSKKMEKGYPKLIKADFPGIGGQVNAALESNGIMYLFNGPRIFEYDFQSKKVLGVLNGNYFLGCQK